MLTRGACNTHCHSQGNAWHLHGYVQVYAISWSLPLTAVQPQGYTAINYLDIFILFLFRINVIIIKGILSINDLYLLKSLASCISHALI